MVLFVSLVVNCFLSICGKICRSHANKEKNEIIRQQPGAFFVQFDTTSSQNAIPDFILEWANGGSCDPNLIENPHNHLTDKDL